MIDGTGTTTYTYDALDRLTGVNDGAGQQVGYGLRPGRQPDQLNLPRQWHGDPTAMTPGNRPPDE